MKYSELIKKTEQAGWMLISQKGSHRKYRLPDGSIEIIPAHGSKEVPTGLAQKLLKKIGGT